MRILVADNDTGSRLILERVVAGWGLQPVAVHDGAEALAALLDASAPQLAVLDWMMPGLSGVDVCRRVRETAPSRYPYLILCTGRGSRDDLIEGLEAGADDYLVKPYDPRELKVRLRAGMRILELLEALRHREKGLEIEASTDPLTGVLNRRGIESLLNREIKRAGREGKPFSVAILDLDHFKRINDTLGHLAGDAILRKACRLVSEGLRAYDSLGRWGGEEFLLVLPSCGREEARGVVERVRASIARLPLETPDGRVALTASAGVASLEGAFGGSAEALIREADEALYLAKSSGRNRVVFNEDGPQAPPRPSRPASSADAQAFQPGLSPSYRLFETGRALERMAGDEDLLQEVAATFLEDAPKKLDAMREALASGDAAAMNRVAHGLKGSAAAFGDGLAADLLEIETRARGGSLDEIAPLLDRVEGLTIALLGELKRFLLAAAS